MSTINEVKFIDVFKNGLKIIPRTLSVKTLLSERNLRRIDYKPYYQRNYVWDTEKQTFFIESVLLGTEIPPLILYKSGLKTEVIDGRQRFETLKRFKENELVLSSKGLMDLPALSRKSFNNLDDELKEVFLNSYIRIFEFEVITEISSEVEDKIKKEIFRRYNTGITPLTSVEVDSAKYDNDSLSEELDNYITDETTFYEGLIKCFFPNDGDTPEMKGKVLDFLRKALVIPKIPIYRYARSSGRSEIIELLYKSLYDTNTNIELNQLISCCKKVINLQNKLSNDNSLFNKQKLMYEAILWALLVILQEDISFDIDTIYENIRTHYTENIELYSDDNSFYYKNIYQRYLDTSNFFKKHINVDFDLYMVNTEFNNNIKKLKQDETEVKDAVQQLSSLRINKPSPVSKPVEEILSDVITNKYLIRPSYQRQEKISELKASSIIESILLGISLPPIFIYKKNNGIKEVVDGQQRLLSVISFVGKQYRDENDKLTYSKNNNFKLKKLKILTDLNGCNFSDLSTQDQDKILDFVIDEIIIEQNINGNFDPTDLFIRLNQKPYPIQQNSFEMWNSTVEKDVIDKIKEVTNKHINWFFNKENKDIQNRTDRMENEELVTLLSYIDYQLNKVSYDKILGMFKRIDRITCRIKDKNSITDYLMHLEDDTNEKKCFINSIMKTDEKISEFGKLFDNNLNKDTLNTFFNIKKSQTFRRSYQDFYIVWLILHDLNITNNNKECIKQNILTTLSLLRNVNKDKVDELYFHNFEIKLQTIMRTHYE